MNCIIALSYFGYVCLNEGGRSSYLHFGVRILDLTEANSKVCFIKLRFVTKKHDANRFLHLHAKSEA